MQTNRDSDMRQRLVDAAVADGMRADQAERMADEAMGDLRMVRTQAQAMEAIFGRR